MKENESLFELIYSIVEQIPCGKVATYGMIAAMTGNPRRSRIVGYALHVNPRPGVVPCHRVVNRFGRPAPVFAFGGEDVQRKMLESEGVEFDENGNVNLEKCLWHAGQN